MAVPIREYRQQTSPSGLGVTPHARAPQLDDSAQVAGMRLAGAAQGAIAHVHEVAKQQEAEDAKVWTAHALAKAQADMAQSFIESQDAATPGAPNFTQQYGDLFDSYSEDALGNAPNDVSKKFLAEGMLRLRADMTGKALEYETGERRKWRVDTGKQAIDAVASTMAADPSRLPVVLAEQHALIDSYAVPPEAKRAMHTYLDEQVATAAVLGDIERSPDAALVQLSRRLGVEVSDVMPASPPMGDRDVQAKYEQIGAALGFRTTSTVRSREENAALPGAAVNSQHLAENGGTARDWSIKGKTPDQIAEMVAALQAEGFEASVHTKGTAPHIHAELPPGRRAAQKPTGLVEAGNINLAHRPVVQNDDGTVSTVRSISTNIDGAEVLIPTVSDDGRILSDDAAIEQYRRTGQHLGKFETVAQANAYAEALHQQQARRTVEQIASTNPEGEKTGSTAYDLLTVPQVVQLIGRAQSEREKQGAAFRSYIAAREADDLAAYGDGQQPPDPLGAGEFIAAFGGVDGARRWQAYQHAKLYAADVATFASKTPDEIAALVAERAPAPGAGYADASRAHTARVQAAVATVQQRAADPVQFAMDNGLSPVQPLDFTNADAMAAGLKARVGTASMMSDLYGTGYTLLTKAEATQMGQLLGGMTAPEKAQLLQGIRGALPDARSYQSVMAVLRPDSPVTATAGSILHVGSARSGVRADAVAQRLLVGEDLLNPPKSASGADGKPKFPMPPETDLRQAWTDYVGTAYAGSPDTEGASYQAFRAYYAAEQAQAGDYTGTFNGDSAARAAEAVTGGVVEVNESTIVLPWGQGERYVIDSLRQSWEAQRTGAGLPSVPFEQIGLQTVGDGVYAVTAGTGPVRGADGQPMLLRVQRFVASEMPQVPTGP
jgi:hypothetical protein